MRDKIAKYLKKKYGTEPECLWKRYPRFAVFRHEDNRKWYAAIMNVTPDKIGGMGLLCAVPFLKYIVSHN